MTERNVPKPKHRLLVVYGTAEGHTRDIATHVAQTARAEGTVVEVAEAATATSLTEAAWDAVLVGASVHQEQHQTSVTDFVRTNLSLLERLPSAFFSVSLSAAVNSPHHQDEAQRYIETFLERTGWHPLSTASFAGALRHAEYDYFQRLVLDLLAYQLGGGTVSDKDVVYTDWNVVDAFVRAFLVAAFTPADPFET